MGFLDKVHTKGILPNPEGVSSKEIQEDVEKIMRAKGFHSPYGVSSKPHRLPLPFDILQVMGFFRSKP